jgi:hypothetical protein
MAIRQPASTNDIRTAIRELSLPAELERRIQAYRDELSKRP